MVTYIDVERAAQNLRGVAVKTPCVRFPDLDRRLGGKLHFKLESLQRGGAFKFRGAYHAILTQLEAARVQGVVTGSSGNHGTALALAARELGVRCRVVMPEDANPVKVGLVRAASAEAEFCGRSSEERLNRARELAQNEGFLLVPPYDDPRVIAGQGTVALEVLEQVPEFDLLLVPCGGGGLLSGCSVAVAARAPNKEVYGVEAETANDTFLSWQRGERVRIPLSTTIADGMRNVEPGAITFPLVRAHAHGILLAEEARLREAVAWFFREGRLVVEPTGAAALAALFSGAIELAGRSVVLVVSGGNIDPVVLRSCME